MPPAASLTKTGPHAQQAPDGLYPPPCYLCRAATLAGLIPSLDSEDFALVYEPEAAALTACAQNNVSVEAGDVFLIVDAGGGTIDFTMHRVEDQAGSKVLSEATYRAMLLEVGASVYLAPALGLLCVLDASLACRSQGHVAGGGCLASVCTAPVVCALCFACGRAMLLYDHL